MRRAIALHVVLPLILGALIYVAWRSDRVELVTWLPSSTVAAARDGARSFSLPRIVLGSAPDAAWGWSFGAALALVWRDRPGKRRRAWLVVGACVAAYAEVGQLWGLPPGTFDVIDLLSIVGAYALAAFVILRRHEPHLGDPGHGQGPVAGGRAVTER
jgi:hypothetical protein